MSIGRMICAIKQEHSYEMNIAATKSVGQLTGESMSNHHDVRAIIVRETPAGASIFYFDHGDKTWWRQDIGEGGVIVGDELYLTDGPE